MAKLPPDPVQALYLVALSLGTEELRHGLDLVLTLALEYTSEHEDWDLLHVEGGVDGKPRYSDYDIACVEATHAWIQRVTGYDAFSRAMKPRDQKK